MARRGFGRCLGRSRKAKRPAPSGEPREPRGSRGHGAGLETAEGRRRRAARSVTSAPARPCGRSSAPLPRQPQRVRGGAREAGSRGPQRRDSPRPPTLVLTIGPPPHAPGPLEPAGGRRGRGTGGMGVPGPLAAADSSAGLCPQPPPSRAAPRRHSDPKSGRDPASFPSEPGPAGAREPGNPSLAARRPQAPGGPARERPRGPREDGGHAKGTGRRRRRSRREATQAPHSPQLLRRGVGSTARGLLGCRTGARA